jgi:hypothetical protein
LYRGRTGAERGRELTRGPVIPHGKSGTSIDGRLKHLPGFCSVGFLERKLSAVQISYTKAALSPLRVGVLRRRPHLLERELPQIIPDNGSSWIA